MKATPRRPLSTPQDKKIKNKRRLIVMAGVRWASRRIRIFRPRRQPLTQRVWAANRYFSSEGIGSTGCDRCFSLRQKVLDLFPTLLNGFVRGRQLVFGRKQKDQPAEQKGHTPDYHRNANRIHFECSKGHRRAVPKGRKGDTSLKISVATCTGFQWSSQLDHLSPTVN